MKPEDTLNHQTKKITNIPLLFILLICFIAIVFSINQIIKMAKPTAYLTAVMASQSTNNKLYIEVDQLSQSSTLLNYQMLESKLSKSFTFQASPTSFTRPSYFNINPEVEKLPASEQNYLIRLKLLEWKFDFLQQTLNKIATQQEEPLIFKLWFWIYSLVIWIGSICLGQVLKHYTDRFICSYC